jgi:redox-sensitive bicupin YhaK (pirin superfamily)
MAVPGHPHTGLQTVSWLFDGQIGHRDTTGAHAVVRPREVNLMTAGTGIADSEFSTPDTLGAEISLATGTRLRLDIEARFEHGGLIDTGDVTVDGYAATTGQLLSAHPAADELTIEATEG